MSKNSYKSLCVFEALFVFMKFLQKHFAGWEIMQWATFLASMSAPAALVVTVYFSYLTYDQSREERIEQREFFISQNAPRLWISKLYVEEAVEISDALGLSPVMMEIENTGRSTAEDVCVQIYSDPLYGLANASGVAPSETYFYTCLEDFAGQRKSILPGDTMGPFAVSSGREFVNFGIDLSHISRAKGTSIIYEGEERLYVDIRYTDVLGNTYHRDDWFIAHPVVEVSVTEEEVEN